MYIHHRIEIKPNQKQITYFRRSFGIARFTYNWGIDMWEQLTKEGKHRSAIELTKIFNGIKAEQYPFVLKVSKSVPEYAFRHLQKAYLNYFKSLKAGDGKYGKPTKKKKRDRFGSFSFKGDQWLLSWTNKTSKALESKPHNLDHKHQYLRLPKEHTYVKMMEPLRFNGKVVSVTILQHSDKFYAIFCVNITEEEYQRTHKSTVGDGTLGIDLGVHSLMALSNGLLVKNPKILEKMEKHIIHLQRKSERCVHPHSKRQHKKGVQKSKNYIKACARYSKLLRRSWSIRDDFDQKLTTCLVRHYSDIALETLNVEPMSKDNIGKNKHQGNKLNRDAAWNTLKTLIVNKAKRMGRKTTQVPAFTKTSSVCSLCGYEVEGLTVRNRILHCPNCGQSIERDYNAALNIEKYLGMGSSETSGSKPADCGALLSDFKKNRIVTTQVEPGRKYTRRSDKSFMPALLV